MKRPIAIALTSMLVVIALSAVFSEALPIPGTIRGRVVAYSDGLTCLNGNAYWLMLIRVQEATDATPKFIQVTLFTALQRNSTMAQSQITDTGISFEAEARFRLGLKGIS